MSGRSPNNFSANFAALNDISAPQRENGGAPSRQSSVSSPSRASLMLLCRQLAPFAISEDATIHRASPARSSHFPSTSLQEELAAPLFTPVETSLDDNKADLERHLWDHLSSGYRRSLRQICRSHNFVDSVAFLSTRIGNKFEVKHLCENDVKRGLEQYREANEKHCYRKKI